MANPLNQAMLYYRIKTQFGMAMDVMSPSAHGLVEVLGDEGHGVYPGGFGISSFLEALIIKSVTDTTPVTDRIQNTY